MNLSKPAALALLAIGVGFMVGFVWGRGTSDALPAATETDFSGGVLTVRVNAGQAVTNGLRGLL